MPNQETWADEIAKGAWSRLRNLIGALDRVDRLETSTEFAGWLHDLAEDQSAMDATMRAFLLRALRQASDPINFQLLQSLRSGGPSTIGRLQEQTKLERVDLVERVNELARAGLTTQALEGEAVQATQFAVAWLQLFDEISEGMKARANEDRLLKPSLPIPGMRRDT